MVSLVQVRFITISWNKAHRSQQKCTVISAKINLKEKQPKLVNRSIPILLQDNTRAHTAQMTDKTTGIGVGVLRYPLYSPDLVLTDYHFLRNLDNFLIGKNFNSNNTVKLVFQDFIDTCPPWFRTAGLNSPLKWQKCVDNKGAYFNE